MDVKLSDLPANLDNPPFIFFPEVVELDGIEEPVRIGSHAYLQRAPESHRIGLSRLLEPYINSRPVGISGVSPWEFREIDEREGGTRFEYITAPDEHQFWIVRYWRKLLDQPLELALELSDPSFTPLIALTQPLANATGRMDSFAIQNWLDANILARRCVFGQKQVEGVELALNLLTDFDTNDDPSFYFIHKALRDFSDLKRVSKRMPLYVVGLFAIIESLLTTPQDTTTGKSLNHQLQEKLTLMESRFHQALSLTNYFGKASTPSFKTVIKKLYQYRSDIAHGNVPDFAKELSILENHRAVCEFLHALVRRLMLQAVQEPTLMRDLKRC